MQTDLTPDQADTIVAAAETVARRLEWRLRLPRGDREDIRQDLLSDLLRRLTDYDPERGSFEAFVHVVLTHRAARTASRIAKDCRSRGGALLSLDLQLDGEPRPLVESIAADDGLWAWLGHSNPDETRVELANDVERVLGLLSDADQCLCAGLASRTVTALVRSGHGSRSHVYRRIADLRCVFAAHGLGPAWDGFFVA